MTRELERIAPLEDLSIRNDGEGRTIDAYAAVFGVRQEIRDQDGHYVEVIHPYAFQRTLEQRAGKFQVLYNHGRSIHGTPSDRYSMPYGTPIELKADQRGLFTSTKVARTPLGDEVLQLVKDGALKGMSFAGTFLEKERLEDDIITGLPTIARTEIALREYGVTPFPAYAAAQVELVRAEAADMLAQLDADDIVSAVLALPDDARAELVRALAPPDPRTGNDTLPDPRTGAATHQKQLAVKLRLAELNVPRRTTA